MEVPASCGARWSTDVESCARCHPVESSAAAPLSIMSLTAPADTLTYQEILSPDSKILATVPAGPVEPGRTFTQRVQVLGFVMVIQYEISKNAGAYSVISYKWPIGTDSPSYEYQHCLTEPGEYTFKAYYIYCSGGYPSCFYQWIRETFTWTVTVSGENYCSVNSVPYLSQNDPAWGTLQYDDMNASIASKGCALTSSVMVLLSHGVDAGVNGSSVNPRTLNNFLHAYGYSVSDNGRTEYIDNGYTKNGAVRWIPHIEEYSRPSFTSTIMRVIYDSSESGDASTSPTFFCSYQRASAGTSVCAVLNRRIDQFLCDGNPVILKVRGSTSERKDHFLVAHAQADVGSTTTLRINDPGHAGFTELANDHYRNRFKGVRLFGPGTSGARPMVAVYLGSPALITAVDAAGLRTGIDSATGDFLKEIPGSNILDEGVEIEEPEWVLYLEPSSDGAYWFRVIGSGEGPYSLDIFLCESVDRPPRVIHIDGEIVLGREYSYHLDFVSGGGSTVTPETYLSQGFLAPLAIGDGKIFKLGSTIPVKLRITRRDGRPHDDITARLCLRQVNGIEPIGDPIIADSSGQANQGNLFRYDPVEDQYVFNLSTKSLMVGTWEFTVQLDDGLKIRHQFGLK